MKYELSELKGVAMMSSNKQTEKKTNVMYVRVSPKSGILGEFNSEMQKTMIEDYAKQFGYQVCSPILRKA